MGKGEQTREDMVEDGNGQLLTDNYIQNFIILGKIPKIDLFVSQAFSGT